jgi:hypothetical protein
VVHLKEEEEEEAAEEKTGCLYSPSCRQEVFSETGSQH